MIRAAAERKKARMPVKRAVVRDSCFTHASMTAPGTTSIQAGSGSRAGVAARSITPKQFRLGSGRAGFNALRFLAFAVCGANCEAREGRILWATRQARNQKNRVGRVRKTADPNPKPGRARRR